MVQTSCSKLPMTLQVRRLVEQNLGAKMTTSENI